MDAKQLLLLIPHSCCCIDCLGKQMPWRQYFPQSMLGGGWGAGKAQKRLWAFVLAPSSLQVRDYWERWTHEVPWEKPTWLQFLLSNTSPVTHTHVNNKEKLCCSVITKLTLWQFTTWIYNIATADNSVRSMCLKTHESTEFIDTGKDVCISFSNTITEQSKEVSGLGKKACWKKSQEYGRHPGWVHCPPDSGQISPSQPTPGIVLDPLHARYPWQWPLPPATSWPPALPPTCRVHTSACPKPPRSSNTAPRLIFTRLPRTPSPFLLEPPCLDPSCLTHYLLLCLTGIWTIPFAHGWVDCKLWGQEAYAILL